MTFFTGGCKMAGEVFSSLITSVNPKLMNSGSRNGIAIDRIVLHHNATTNKDVAMNTWVVGGSAGTSAHYEVTPTEIIGCVGEQYSAFHAGGTGGADIPKMSNPNQRSIGIENVNSSGAPNWSIDPRTVTNCARLVADICKRYGIPCDRQHVLGHNEVTSTACPGGMNVDEVVRQAKQFMAGGNNSAPKPSQTNSRKAFFDIVNVNSGAFNVQGWFIPSKSTKGQSIWLYFMDKATNKEIGRFQGKRVVREDVKKVYPSNPNGAEVGFTVNGLTPQNLMGKEYYFLLRYNNDSKEELYVKDKVFKAPALINRGCLDVIRGDKGQVTLHGWHLSSKRRNSDKHFLFIMDKKTNKEIVRFDVTKYSFKASPDIQKLYDGTIAQRGNCRFAFAHALDAKSPARGKDIYILSRYCSDPLGNTGISDQLQLGGTNKL